MTATQIGFNALAAIGACVIGITWAYLDDGSGSADDPAKPAPNAPAEPGLGDDPSPNRPPMGGFGRGPRDPMGSRRGPGDSGVGFRGPGDGSPRRGPGGPGGQRFGSPNFERTKDADPDVSKLPKQEQEFNRESNEFAVEYRSAPSDQEASQLTPNEIFRSTNIWSIHLCFTPEQWEAMEPKQARGQPRRFGGNWLQGPEGGRNGLMAAQGTNFDFVRADLEFGTSQFKEVGVRYKGNGTFWSSRDSLKRSLKVDLNQFVKGQKLVGMSQINLHNSVRDRSGLNEALAYRLFRDGGVPAPRTAYARVYVTVPGKHEKRYFGLYNLVEDVGSAFEKEHFKTSEGALLKPVTPNLFSDLGDDWKSYNQTYDPKGTLSDEQKKRIIEFCKFTTSASDAEFASKLGDFIDLDNFARYMAITAWLTDLDGILGPGQNYYVYLHPKTQKFMFIPWDQDQSFGQFPRGSREQRENLSIQNPWSGDNRFLAKVFRAKPFKDIYLAKMREFNETLFQSARFTPQVEELANAIRSVIKEESAERLTDLDNTLAGKDVTTSMGPGFNSSVRSIKPFVEARTKSVKDQLEGKSTGQSIRQGFGR